MSKKALSIDLLDSIAALFVTADIFFAKIEKKMFYAIIFFKNVTECF